MTSGIRDLAMGAKGDSVTRKRLERSVEPGGWFGIGGGTRRPVDALTPGEQPHYLYLSYNGTFAFSVDSIGGKESCGPAALLLTDQRAVFVTEESDFAVPYEEVTTLTTREPSNWSGRKIVVSTGTRTYRMVAPTDAATVADVLRNPMREIREGLEYARATMERSGDPDRRDARE